MIKIKRIYHRGEHFISSFHTGTGSYVRTAVLKGEREGKDPFRRIFRN